MSWADLLFRSPAGGSDLVFGDEGEVETPYIAMSFEALLPELTLSVRVIPDRHATFSAVIPDSSTSVSFIPDRRVSVYAALAALTFVADVEYASRTVRPIIGKLDTDWQRAAESEVGVDSAFASTVSRLIGSESVWQTADLAEQVVDLPFSDAVRRVRPAAASRFSGALRLPARYCAARHQDGLRDRRIHRGSEFAGAERLAAARRTARHQDADHRPRLASASTFQSAVTVRQTVITLFGAGADLRVVASSRAQQAIRPPAGKYIKPSEPDHPGYEPNADLLFVQRADGSAALLFANYASSDSTIVVPARRVYYMVNEQSVTRVSDGKVIHCSDLRLSIDVDSWVWGWSATIPGRQLDDVRKTAEQVELEATINGHVFRVMVEKITRDRSFKSSRIAVSGRGKAAWLDSPYATVRSFTNSSAQLAQQLMANALTENGVSLGWDLDWQIVDWLVPANIWSCTGTPIAACMTIAESVGACIQAHPSSKILRVLPRYPVAPWHWDELTPDFELPEDVCSTEGIEWIEKPAYNTVFVAGQESGVLAHVTRSGTDGGTPAPMVTDPLITHANAGRQRGLSILSDTGDQALISVSLPVLKETGIIFPGKFVRYRESGNTHLGLVRGVDVSANFPKVRQTIRLETHVL